MKRRRAISFPSSDASEDARRRRLLNISLLGVLVIGTIGTLLFLWGPCNKWTGYDASSAEWCIYVPRLIPQSGDFYSDTSRIVIVFWFAVTLLCLALLLANRAKRISPTILTSILLAGFTIVILLSDAPEEIIGGQSTVLLLVPVVFAAYLTRPFVSFIIGVLETLGLIYFTYVVLDDPTKMSFAAVGVIMVVALGSWVAGRSIEKYLAEARALAAQRDAVFRSIPDPVLLVSPEGVLQTMNPAGQSVIPGAIAGSTTADDMDAFLCGPASHGLLRDLAVGKAEDGQLRCDQTTFLASSTPVPDLGRVLVLHDISETIRAEDAKRVTLALANHELRTPLANIAGYTELIQQLQGGGIDVQLAAALRIILQNAERMSRTMDSIHILAQIQAGMLEIRRAEVTGEGLSAQLEKRLEPLSGEAEQKGLAFRLENHLLDDQTLVLDVRHTAQVLFNLVSNAVKFTATGEVVITLVLSPDALALHITVSDTGEGVAPDEIPHLFKRFELAGQDYMSRQTQGIGLGLAVVKELVDRMGGEVSAASQPGQGSVFTVMLPVAE
ncbi:MAG: HAMP domain-containing histidine kinase [Anaerolineales bacterium]|nr:HAMP domain-containing histidine kinase [Anaerolineales bacterium]